MEKTTLSVSIGFKTHVGRIREKNEDSYAVLRRTDLLDTLDALIVVADGMGGGRGGDIASTIVAKTLPDVVLETLSESDGRSPDTPRLMRSGILRANSNVWNQQVEQPELRGMGTTCVAAILQEGVLTVGNAGDSRAYLLRDGKLSQITEDHSEVWQQVKAGNMTREQARRSRYRNVVTNGIGLRQEMSPDVERYDLTDGDTVLLCSDGLTTEVGDTEIARLLASTATAQEACDRLVDAALRRGGSDNITVVVLRYGDFVPIALSDRVPASLGGETEEDEDEEITDRNAEWRTASRSADHAPSRPPTFIANASDEDEDYDEDYEEPPRRSRNRGEDEEARAAHGGGGLAIVTAIVLLFLLVGESIALYIAMSNRKVTMAPLPRRGASSSADTDEEADLKKTDKDLQYFDPEPLYEKPVRDTILQIGENGNLIVAAQDGTLLQVSPDGMKATKLPDPKLPPSDKPEGEAKKPKGRLCIAYDASGNRYQTNLATKCIFKYDASGTRKKDDIGMTRVMAPTNMVIDRSGNIYLIDEHHLKKITAYDSHQQMLRDRDQKMNQ